MKSKIPLLALLLVTSAARADMYTIETSGHMRLNAKHMPQTCKYGQHEFQPGDTVVQENGKSRLNLVCVKTDVGGTMYMLSASEVVGATKSERDRMLKDQAARRIREYCKECTPQDVARILSTLDAPTP